MFAHNYFCNCGHSEGDHHNRKRCFRDARGGTTQCPCEGFDDSAQRTKAEQPVKPDYNRLCLCGHSKWWHALFNGNMYSGPCDCPDPTKCECQKFRPTPEPLHVVP